MNKYIITSEYKRFDDIPNKLWERASRHLRKYNVNPIIDLYDVSCFWKWAAVFRTEYIRNTIMGIDILNLYVFRDIYVEAVDVANYLWPQDKIF